ncbi:hypothetical protein ACIQUE_23550 [Bacillus cereus]|uniref:hypothetical protein n=1 Tax=Bacillus cereus group TaxID=86661 RepID=UPI0033984588
MSKEKECTCKEYWSNYKKESDALKDATYMFEFYGYMVIVVECQENPRYRIYGKPEECNKHRLSPVVGSSSEGKVILKLSK